MKKIFHYLLLTVCLIGSLKVNINAAENTDRLIDLTGISNVKIYTADKKTEMQLTVNIIMKVVLELAVNL